MPSRRSFPRDARSAAEPVVWRVGRGVWGIVAILVTLLGGAGLWWLRGGAPVEPPRPSRDVTSAAADRYALPAITASSYRNTGPAARYVGSLACALCHPNQTATFRETGMGRSMAEVDPTQAVPNAEFVHEKSQRRYQVRRRDGQIWHRELRQEEGTGEAVLAEYPLAYVVGSGRHARTYLAEADGFLVESPVTWYAARERWDMSPGYDRPDHQSFARGVGESCLFCHAGRAEAVGDSTHHMRIIEAAIGCERCHGPGSLHVERQNADGFSGRDETIVNPHHLSRDLAEAVCQQCHLHTDAMVPVRGRTMADFRPGLPLSDFQQEYVLEVDDKPLRVVGHVEQMHLSRCYTESATLTCTTCHNPHARPAPDEQVAHYRAICLQCHQPHDCTVDAERLRTDSPDNDCTHCHMPRSATDVAHVSFTDHRIGLHDKPAAASPPAAEAKLGTLRPWWDPAKFGELDQQRSLGLGYLELAQGDQQPALSAAYKEWAYRLLSAVHQAGLPDAMLEARLARLQFERNETGAMSLARQALARPHLTASDRCTALFVVGAEQFRQQHFTEAAAIFRQLTTLRRHPHDWVLLGACEKALGHPTEAADALRRAERISPPHAPPPQ